MKRDYILTLALYAVYHIFTRKIFHATNRRIFVVAGMHCINNVQNIIHIVDDDIKYNYIEHNSIHFHPFSYNHVYHIFCPADEMYAMKTNQPRSQ